MAGVISVATYTRKAKRAIEADGLNDITRGLYFVAMGFSQYGNKAILVTTAPYHTPFSHTLLVFLGMVALLSVAFSANLYAATLRERFVYPRLGYVAQPRVPQYRLFLTLCALSLAGGVLAMFLYGTVSDDPDIPLPFWYNGLLVGQMGCVFGGGCLYLFATLRFFRHLVLGVVTLTSAFLLAQPQVKVVSDTGILYAVMGAASILVGAVAFAGVLRQPRLTDTEINAEDDRS